MALKPPKDTKQDKAEPGVQRSMLNRFSRKRPNMERRHADDLDEIDERELDKIAGGRMHRIDL